MTKGQRNLDEGKEREAERKIRHLCRKMSINSKCSFVLGFLTSDWTVVSTGIFIKKVMTSVLTLLQENTSENCYAEPQEIHHHKAKITEI